MGLLGYFIAIYLFIIALLAVIFNGGKNLIMVIISLELILLSIGLIFIHFSFNYDDLIGTTFTLYLLPLAGAESAVALALLVAYYPKRGTIALTK